MGEGNVLDYARVFVRNRLFMQSGMVSETGVPTQSAEQILQDLPVYIRKAIVGLQYRGLFAPRELAFEALDRKREVLNPDGTLRYNYLALPSDFREVKEFYFGNTTQPKYTSSTNYAAARAAIDNETKFRVEEGEAENGDREYRLIVEPFPQDDVTVYLRYFIDGTDTSAASVPERYWEAILSFVMTDLGLISSYEAETAINDRVFQDKHMEGKNALTGGRRRTIPGFFTKTSPTGGTKRI